MKGAFTITAICIFLNNIAFSQALYMPRNIQNAYKNGTRDTSGAPGPKYWTNKSEYIIDATVNAVQKTVSGKEKIVYNNYSPDTLKSVIIRFVNNIHKPEAPRAGQVSKDFLTTGLSIKSFIVNGDTYTINSDDWGTANKVVLKKEILPHSRAEFDIEWSYPLSKQSDREGQIDSNTFFCAYFYPRISVYDDYNGWDRLPHTNGQEFYNDFNDYTVNIKAPTNYVVWATGVFENPKDVLQPNILKRFKESQTGNKVINIANIKEMQQGAVTKENEWNEWKFTAKNVPDFTFGASNHYVWDAGSVNVSDTRKVSVQAAYNDTAADYKNYVRWTKECIKWFSDNIPGVPYPYPTMTAFQGYADMEYPMMVNDASTDNMKFSQLVVNHEVAHTYFPFYMGINETRYAYMDEGWATTLEYLIGIAQNGKGEADEAYKNFRVQEWIYNTAAEMDQPVITMSSQLSGGGYGNNSYVKASLSYLALKDLLGDASFKRAILFYMGLWNGKHPIPWDYFNCINTATKQNLNWFWHNWFFTNNYIDLKIKAANAATNNTSITIENIGGFAIPFDVIITPENGKEKKYHYTPIIWQKNEKEITITVPSNGKVNKVVVDGGIFMDAVPADNQFNL